MPFKISTRPKNKHRVRFPKSKVTPSTPKPSTNVADVSATSMVDADQISDDIRSDSGLRLNSNSAAAFAHILPIWILTAPPIEDDLAPESESLELEKDTAEECLEFLLGQQKHLPYNADGVVPLNRSRHVSFLKRALDRLPAPFVGLDASRPWMLYWALVALSTLGQDTTRYRYSLISSLEPIQNVTGGFGGGQGQFSHLATSYAAILSLATVGGHEAYELVNRKALWQWLGRLKQPGGEFEVCEGGEVDIRGVFCAMVMLSLLNLPLDLPQDSPARIKGDETFLTGLVEWIGQCQTFDGGLGSTPGAEAHGAYTFCGLACLCLLGDPREMLTKHLDFPALLRWLTARQHAPEGGLAGRANKLVDGCYSHWLGGCWSLVEAAARDFTHHEDSSYNALFNREGLLRYILCCGQAEGGGLRDKPSKPPDAYHTQYCLSGLSAVQNYYSYNDNTEIHFFTRFPAAFKWVGSRQLPGAAQQEPKARQIFSENDRVSLVHPIYVIPFGAPEAMSEYFANKPIT